MTRLVPIILDSESHRNEILLVLPQLVAIVAWSKRGWLLQNVAAVVLHNPQTSISFVLLDLAAEPDVEAHRRVDQVDMARAHLLGSHSSDLQLFEVQIVVLMHFAPAQLLTFL